LYREFDDDYGFSMLDNNSPDFLFKSVDKNLGLDYAEPCLAEIHYINSHQLYMDKF